MKVKKQKAKYERKWLKSDMNQLHGESGLNDVPHPSGPRLLSELIRGPLHRLMESLVSPGEP